MLSPFFLEYMVMVTINYLFKRSKFLHVANCTCVDTIIFIFININQVKIHLCALKNIRKICISQQVRISIIFDRIIEILL